METIKHDHNPRWYFLFSLFAVLILIGAFTSLYHYAQAVMLPSQQGMELESMTLKAIEGYPISEITASNTQDYQPDLKGPLVLVLVGIAGFLFTKFAYERHIRRNSEA